ncbi:Flagellin [Sulfidibacter corallicola]|uniref:Flagellin n=1 Tax=Sulfidibacter corallicola TaxID=2818388 RepID=A0A8A4TVI2_SULCO|nr:flagellin [Sulfidibacter corallicola]QTD53178.1 hypothetical protein J3U87_12030 [Sulfidibacter corallicola]
MVAISSFFGADNALLRLQSSERNINRSLERLSSGERILEAADDRLDLQIANNLRSEIRSYSVLKRDHFDSMNFIQVADGHLEEMSNVLTRITELATEAASGTTGPDNSNAKLALDAEFQSLLEDIDQINDEVRFSNVTVFGSAGTTMRVNLTIDAADPTETLIVTTSTISTTALGLAMGDLTTELTAGNALTAAKAAIEQVNRQRGRLGAMAVRINENMDFIDERIINMQDQESLIRDTDIAEETVALTKFQILNQSNVSVMAQANLNVNQVLSLLG